jgi:hypothetical protein
MRIERYCVIANDGSHALVVQHRRHVYSLTITSRFTGHNRWGTLAEITTDQQHFITHGVLPVSKGATGI